MKRVETKKNRLKPKRKRTKKRHSKWNDSIENQNKLDNAIKAFKGGAKLTEVSKQYGVPTRTIKRYCDGTHVTTLLNRIDEQDEQIKILEAVVCGDTTLENKFEISLMDVVKNQELEIQKLKNKINALEFKLSYAYAFGVQDLKARLTTPVLNPDTLD